MNQALLSLTARELTAWIFTPVLYCHVALFSLITLSGMFLLSGFIEAGEAELSYSFFRWHPWAYALVTPVIGIRSWSEEHRSRLFESLATQPISFIQLTIAKTIGGAFVVITSLFFTLSAVATVISLGNPDIGVILCAYFGSALLGLSVAFLSQAVAAFMDGSVASYVCSAGLTLLLILIGTENVANRILNTFPGLEWATQILSTLSLTSKYAPFLEGRLQLNAVCGFALIMITSILSTQWALMRQRTSKSTKTGKKRIFSKNRGLPIAGGFVALAFLSNSLPGMLDLTEHQRHSLPRPIERHLSGIDKHVTIRIYATHNHPKFGYNDNRHFQLIKEVTNQIEDTLAKNLRVDILNSNESSKAARLAAADNITSITTNEGEPFIFGLTIESLDRKRVFEMIRSDQNSFSITDYIRAILDISGTKIKRIGIITPFDKNRDDPLALRNWTGLTALERSYHVDRISIDNNLDEYDIIIFHHFPLNIDRSKLELTNQRLDHYVTKGGNIVFLPDPFSLMVNRFSTTGNSKLLSSQLPEYVTRRGITMPKDEEIYDFALATKHPAENGTVSNPAILTLSQKEFNSNHAITRGIDYGHLFHSGHLRIADRKKYKTTVLVRTSADATTLQAIKSDREAMKRVEKAMKSISKNSRAYPLMVIQEPIDRGAEGSIVVAADADWLFSAAAGERTPDGSIISYNGNIALLESIVDYLSEDELLSSLRLIDFRKRPLSEWNSIKLEIEKKYRPNISRAIHTISELKNKLENSYHSRRLFSEKSNIGPASAKIKSLEKDLRIEQYKLTQLRSLREAEITRRKNSIAWLNVLGGALLITLISAAILTWRSHSTRGG